MTTIIQGIKHGDITLQRADTLELVELNNNMQWVDRHVSTGVAGTRLRTLGGKQVVFRDSLIKGTNITLEAQQNTGWVRWDELSILQTWGDIASLDTKFNFVFFGETHTVLFNHTEGPAVQFRQLQSRQNAAGGWFIGTLKLFTV